MSKISDAYDEIVTRVAAALPSHTRFSNPYKLNENTSLFLKQGFGVGFGSGVFSGRQITCNQQALTRTMFIAITREYFAKESNAVGKADTEKSLMEDLLLVLQAIQGDYDLNGKVFDARYSSDSGIQYVQNERDNFMSITLDLQIEYFENLTS